jgi:endonuclease/exonuclease/phosphatase family metal-dependent hydrolase
MTTSSEQHPIRIAAWNIKDGLSNPDRSPMLVAAIERENPTAVVLSEAYSSSEPGNIDNAFEDFYKRGYNVFSVDQEIHDTRPDSHGLVLATKKEFTQYGEVISLAGRFALQAAMTDPNSGRTYKVIGHHGNDKNRKLRQADASALRRHLDVDSDGKLCTPTIYAGDLNTDDRVTPMTMALRAAHPFAYLLPSKAPDPKDLATGIRRIGSVARRSSGMVSGKAMEIVKSYGFVEADGENTPTISEFGVDLKLDHIMVSRHFLVALHRVNTRNVAEEAGLYSPASDHRAISADMFIA